jgi:hypothetical protein
MLMPCVSATLIYFDKSDLLGMWANGCGRAKSWGPPIQITSLGIRTRETIWTTGLGMRG